MSSPAGLAPAAWGEVYRARDSRLGRDVAIKVLPTAFSADPERLRRFEKEARAPAALNHPNLLAVDDIGTDDGSPYIVSEFLEGETLRERITASSLGRPDRVDERASGSGPHDVDAGREAHVHGLPIRRAIDGAIQIARGLAAAHDKGIVHRDLKPENVFARPTGASRFSTSASQSSRSWNPRRPAQVSCRRRRRIHDQA